MSQARNFDFDQVKAKIDDMFQKFLHKPAEPPSTIKFKNDHVFKSDKQQKLQQVPPWDNFKLEEDYFEVVVNELFLAYSSKLWVQIDPTVLVNTKFGYDHKDFSVPYIVGPSSLSLPQGGVVPKGGKMVFSNTPVAGLYPYKGGRLNLTIVLSQVGTQSYAKTIIKLVESVAGALDYSTQLGAYIKIAGVIIDGIESLAGITNGFNPVMGYTTPFSGPGYYALINKPQTQVDSDQLWVVNDELRQGKDQDSAKPFLGSDTDYVLYSVNGAKARNDMEFLSFYASYQKILDDAARNDDSSWKRAVTDMSTLYMTMYKSPDLTQTQALELYNAWKTEMTRIHDMNNPPSVKSIPPSSATFAPKVKKPELTAEEKKVLKESLKVLSLLKK